MICGSGCDDSAFWRMCWRVERISQGGLYGCVVGCWWGCSIHFGRLGGLDRAMFEICL
ncbi:hypothetical protein BDW69DRAFT_179013 [Aspergillus filifer]